MIFLAHWIGVDRNGLATRSRPIDGSDIRVATRRGPVMYISRPAAFAQLSMKKVNTTSREFRVGICMLKADILRPRSVTL